MPYVDKWVGRLLAVAIDAGALDINYLQVRAGREESW
jgi:hypothetical protein